MEPCKEIINEGFPDKEKTVGKEVKGENPMLGG